ncbi:hypothetical protein [Parafrankia sp. EUN1f]|nr:hypothetical protein [Parafrankia sp. EUN1f]EFC83957.1 hypothetical protein FrEUN1fDRAFT_2913 [Parafrankia sp. EUN1f]
MPTYEAAARFLADYHRLRPEQRAAFQTDPHIIWARVGTHDIFRG